MAEELPIWIAGVVWQFTQTTPAELVDRPQRCFYAGFDRGSPIIGRLICRPADRWVCSPGKPGSWKSNRFSNCNSKPK